MKTPSEASPESSGRDIPKAPPFVVCIALKTGFEENRVCISPEGVCYLIIYVLTL